jgi:lysophospholipid hydrolase
LIEDCWLPYFAVTANITYSRTEAHTQGYMWRYIRASMSLSGYFPPICDNGNMLMDGGYFNNVPADVMKDFGANTIIAVDVGYLDDTTPVTYGDKLSGWWLLLRRMFPFVGKKYGPIPTLSDVQARLAYASSVPVRAEISKMENCFYLTPPIQHIGTMEFEKFSEVEKIGYDYARQIIAEWSEKGILQDAFGVKLEKLSPYTRRASI